MLYSPSDGRLKRTHQISAWPKARSPLARCSPRAVRPPLPGQRRDGGVGSVKGRVWGGGGSVLGLATLLAALQTCRGVVLQHFGGDCKPRTPLCGGKGARACVPGGVQEGTDPPGVPVSTVCTARGGTCLSPGPTDPNLPGSTAAPAATQLRGGTAVGSRIPPGGLRGRSCVVLSDGGAHPVAVVSPPPIP